MPGGLAQVPGGGGSCSAELSHRACKNGRRKLCRKSKQNSDCVQRVELVAAVKGLTRSLSCYGHRPDSPRYKLSTPLPKAAFNPFTLFLFLVLMTTNCVYNVLKLSNRFFFQGKLALKCVFYLKPCLTHFSPKHYSVATL